MSSITRYEARQKPSGRWAAYDVKLNRWGSFQLTRCETRSKEGTEALISIWERDMSMSKHKNMDELDKYEIGGKSLFQ